MSRNLRKKPRISYYEMEEPDLDEYIYCDECCDYVFEYCSIHGPLLVIPDDKVPSPTGFPPVVPRAALTIPQEFLHLNHSSIPGAGLGVFASMTLPRGVRFGPYRGERSKEAKSDYCWQLYSGSARRRPTCVVDAGDPARSNWMRYVNCPRHVSEQNLVAFQYKGELYYRTIKIIPRFTELMVFYGAQFANFLHVNLRLYNTLEGYVRLFGLPPQAKKLALKASHVEENKITKNQPVDTGLVASTSVDNNNENAQNKLTEKKPVTRDAKVSTAKDKCKAKPPKKKLKISKTKYLSTDSKNKKDHAKVKPDEKKLSKTVAKQKPKNFIAPVKNVQIAAVNKIVETNSEIKNTRSEKVISKFAAEKIQDKNNNSVRIVSNGHTCNICDFTTNKENILKAHLKAHSAVKHLSCDQCSYITTTKNCFKVHLRTHTGEKPFPCEICNKNFTLQSSLLLHLRIHSGEKRFVCDVCDMKFVQKNHLDFHRYKHSGEKPYVCDVCDKKFAQKGHLVRHLRIHIGEKPYVCNVCDKKFADPSALVIHKRIHTGEKPYVCDICDKKFALKHHLVIHKRIHTGEKPYVCDVCDKKFTKTSDLVRHKRTHTGEKPYVCDICDKKFTRSSNLTKHRRKHTSKV